MGLPVYRGSVSSLPLWRVRVNGRFDLRFVESVLAGQHAAVEDASDEDPRWCLSIEDDVTALFDSAQTGTFPTPESSYAWALAEANAEGSDLAEVKIGLRFSPGIKCVFVDGLQV
jgi:hypothetical protein